MIGRTARVPNELPFPCDTLHCSECCYLFRYGRHGDRYIICHCVTVEQVASASCSPPWLLQSYSHSEGSKAWAGPIILKIYVGAILAQDPKWLGLKAHPPRASGSSRLLVSVVVQTTRANSRCPAVAGRVCLKLESTGESRCCSTRGYSASRPPPVQSF